MTTNGQWVQTSQGRYVFDQGDGWYFDHLDQQWYLGDVPASMPTGAPAAATRRRFWHRLTQRPQGIFMAGWNGWTQGWFLGTIVAVATWACRGWIVYALGWVVLHAGGIYRDAQHFWAGLSVTGPNQAAHREARDALIADGEWNLLIDALIYLVFAFLAFLVLLMTTLNPTQQAALTTAFVAHRMYRHFVQDMGGDVRGSARPHNGSPRS